MYNKSDWKQIVTQISSCMFQLAVGYICVELMMGINLHFLTQYTSTTQTAAFGVAWLVMGISILPFGIGINHNLNSQVSQALGQNQRALSHFYLNFTLYSHLAYFIPIAIFISFLKWPFSYLISEERELTINLAWNMLPYLLITTFLMMQFECFKSYLISCKVTSPFLYIHLSSFVLHIFWCWFYMGYLKMDYRGVCIASITSELFNCIILLVVILKTNIKSEFKNFEISNQLIKNLELGIKYFKSSLPFIIHIYSNSVIFYILSFTAVGLGIAEMNAQMALTNTSSMYFRIPLSLSIALTTFIGNECSNSNILRGKLFMKIGLLLYLGILISLILMISIFHRQWVEFYTKDSEVSKLLEETFPYFVFGSILMDGLQIAFSGILKGLDYSQIVSTSTLWSNYLIGIPLIMILTFLLNFELIGIWLGFGFANFIICVYYGIFISKIDWEMRCLEIQKKLQDQAKQLEQTQELQTLTSCI